MTLTQSQLDLLEACAAAHENGVNGGISGRTMTLDQLQDANALLIDGLALWHPPGPVGEILMPTILGRACIADVLEHRTGSTPKRKAAPRRKRTRK
jgi:hypothetical protein